MRPTNRVVKSLLLVVPMALLAPGCAEKTGEPEPGPKPAKAPVEKAPEPAPPPPVKAPEPTPPPPPPEKPPEPIPPPPEEKPAPLPEEKPVDKPPEMPPEKPADMPADKPAEKPAVEPAEKVVDKPADKPAEELADKPADKPAEKQTGNKPGMLIPAFTATAHVFDGEGVKDESMESQKTAKVTVWMVSSATCPYTKDYAPLIAELEKEYGGKGVRFVHVYPNSTETVEAKRAFHKEKGLTGAWIEDEGAKIAKLLDAKRTPEIYVAGTDGMIAYRGAIDDSGGDYTMAKKRYLRDALDSVLAGTEVAVKETVPAG